MRSSNITVNHSKIREWVERRGGRPARVMGTGHRGDPGLLRIDFPDYSGRNLQGIGWDEFFDKFEREDLAFLYQDRKRNGEISYFNKLVSADEYYEEGS